MGIFYTRKYKKYTPVEEALPCDMNRIWYQIPGFPGYELSSDGFLRSMKHFKRYPYGLLLQPSISKRTKKVKYTLTNYMNVRQTLGLDEILALIKNGSGYTSAMNETNVFSRNRHVRNFAMNADKYIELDFPVNDSETKPQKPLTDPLIFYNQNTYY